jgi:lipid-binding SYLF domain-containing protein
MTRTHATAWLLCSALVIPALHAAQNEDERSRRISDSIAVLQDLTAAPDNRIPDHLLTRAEAIVVIPSLVKGGFIIGAKHGTGVISVRDRRLESWSDPAFVKMTGGSIGWQIGGSESDVVLLVMTETGAKKLMESKFTLDANASAAAGPVGRTAQASTDAKMTAGILSYSRARGLFAGLSIGGATLRQDLDENAELYGSKLTNKEIITGNVKPPASADRLRAALSKHSHVEEGQRARQRK